MKNKRTTKIEDITSNPAGYDGVPPELRVHKITFYMNGKFLVDCRKTGKDYAEHVAREYRETGVCPTY
jgi:hypothetical protein